MKKKIFSILKRVFAHNCHNCGFCSTNHEPNHIKGNLEEINDGSLRTNQE